MARHPLVVNVFGPAAHVAKGLRDITQAGPAEYHMIRDSVKQLQSGLDGIEPSDFDGYPPTVQKAIEDIAEIVKGMTAQVGYADVVLHLKNSDLEKHAKDGWRAIEAPRYGWEREQVHSLEGTEKAATQANSTNDMRWLTLEVAARRSVTPLEGEYAQQFEELRCRLRVAAAEMGLCARTDSLDDAAIVVRDWMVSRGASFDDAMKTPVVDALAELAGEAENAALPDDESEPAKPTDDEQPEPGSDNGVTLFDLAFLIEEDDAVAKQTVKQWVDNKRIKAKPIGKCPLDARRQLYRLSEILSDVAKFLSLTPREKAKYRQVLTAKLRTPRSD